MTAGCHDYGSRQDLPVWDEGGEVDGVVVVEAVVGVVGRIVVEM